MKRLGPRWFVVRDAKHSGVALLHPRWAMSLLRGPMTPGEIRRACEHGRSESAAPAAHDA